MERAYFLFSIFITVIVVRIALVMVNIILYFTTADAHYGYYTSEFNVLADTWLKAHTKPRCRFAIILPRFLYNVAVITIQIDSQSH